VHEALVARQVEAAIEKHVGKKFAAFVRSIEDVRTLLDADPYKPFRLPKNSKRVVTFLRTPPKSPLALPIERDGARILKLFGRELLSADVVSDMVGEVTEVSRSRQLLWIPVVGELDLGGVVTGGRQEHEPFSLSVRRTSWSPSAST
jgi:Protein of unknown function (DUF1697)